MTSELVFLGTQTEAFTVTLRKFSSKGNPEIVRKFPGKSL